MKRLLPFLTLFLLSASCQNGPPPKKCMEVSVSAYNSLPYQTRPGTAGNITAWGDTLDSAKPSIAVSRDLLDSGLTYGAMVHVHGFADTFVVNDKMNVRFKNAIDIHMGRDVRKAREFGRQKRTICWTPVDSAKAS